jgi:hypothetical protein
MIPLPLNENTLIKPIPPAVLPLRHKPRREPAAFRSRASPKISTRGSDRCPRNGSVEVDDDHGLGSCPLLRSRSLLESTVVHVPAHPPAHLGTRASTGRSDQRPVPAGERERRRG